MSFTVTRLVNSRAIVRGTDVFGKAGQTVVNTTQWDELNARDDFSKAEAEFEAAVEAFFKPVSEAADKLKDALERPTDSVAYVVLDEGSEGEARRPKQLVQLSHDSIVLRLIEQGETTRLVWVDEGTIEVLEAMTDETKAEVEKAVAEVDPNGEHFAESAPAEQG